MAQDRLTIEPATVFNNITDRQIEFAAELGGERYQFAVRYDVLEALGGAVPDADATPLFQRHRSQIETAGASAVARGPERELVIISETDLA